MDEGLGGLVEVPLRVAAEPRAVVENAEQLRLLPLSARRQDRTRALVKVQMSEAVHVRDLVRARLARPERLALGVFPIAPFAGAQETLLLHEAAHRRVAGHGPEARVFARERDEVVVMKLEGPARMIAVLARDRLGERGAQARMGARMRGDPTREGGERIVGAAGDVATSARVSPRRSRSTRRWSGDARACGERLDARLELAVVDRRQPPRGARI